jgi:hypothetical protein
LSESVGEYNYILGVILESDGKVIGSYLKVNQQILTGSIYQIIEGIPLPIMSREQVMKRLTKGE